MEDLRRKEEAKKKKTSKFKMNFMIFWKKRKWWIILFLILGVITFFPEFSGQAIGQWIHDFIGNIVKYSKF